MPTIEQDSFSQTVISLGTTRFEGTLISHEIAGVLRGIKKNEKILLLYNRRGLGRAWICRDCGYFPKCPECDVALAYHAYPSKQLVCHHCSYRTDIGENCPHCGSLDFQEVGIGIQKIVADLKLHFPQYSLFRFDSDAKEKKSELYGKITESDIIISTYRGISFLHDERISSVVFLLFESDLTLPDYRMEEDLYHTIEYAKKSKKNIYIQTFTPDHPLLQMIIEGNYRDFLQYITSERKKFSYPPYGDFVTIRIHDSSREKLENMFTKIINKIEIIKNEDISCFYDRDTREKYAGEWVAKIYLKGKNITSFLSLFEVELIKNRSITLEWN